MSKWKDHGGGYYVRESGEFFAIIRKSGTGWYGGAAHNSDSSSPLHGPYRLKRTAKKKAIQQLCLIDFVP